jgi:hypothetical protein
MGLCPCSPIGAVGPKPRYSVAPAATRPTQGPRAGSITEGIERAMWVFLVLAAGLAIPVWKTDETSHRIFYLFCCLLNLFCFADIYRKAHPYMFAATPRPPLVWPAPLPDCPANHAQADFPPQPCKPTGPQNGGNSALDPVPPAIEKP